MRKIFHRFFTIVAIVFVGLLLADVARACSCITPDIDQQIKASTDIAIFKLKNVTKYKDNEESFDEERIKQSTLVVQKVFKGNLKIGQEVNFTQGGGADCVWGVSEKEKGENFLLFLNQQKFMYSSSKRNRLWEAHICSRSGSVKEIGDDLLYLEKFKKVKGKTRLSGVIFNVTEKKTDAKKPWREWDYEPIAGRKLRIIGNGVDVTVKTNKLGAYEVYDLPVGKYRLIPQEVKGYRILIPDNETTDEVEIKAKSLVKQNIEYLVD